MGFLTLLASLVSLLHVGQMAEYKYSIVNERVQLEIMLEHSEMKTLQLDDSCNANTMTALCLSNYIIKNSELKINDVSIHFELMKSHILNDHLVIFLISTTEVNSIESVKIRYSTFYEFYSDYKNRCILNLGRFKGTYMLTKDKNSISLFK